MGDREKASLRLQFNPQIRLELHGATITSDAGLLAFRELDDALDLTPIASDYLQESRTGRNIRHHLVPLLRQSIYSRLAGYDDTNDAERLSQDPAMRVVVGWQGSDRNAARTNTMSRFETETLTQEDNLKGLALMNPQWVELAMAHTPHRRVILDMDSSESPVHGQQEGAAYNGHFECVCYHPLFLFNQFGDCEGATLRPGNVHSADGWQELLEPVVKGYQKKGLRLLFRGDAAFAKPELYEYLGQGKIGYAIRLPANQVIQEQIQPLLERPTEWPSREPIVSYHDFAYQAQSWHLPRRVVAKIEWHQGELFPRVGFIVTNLSYPPEDTSEEDWDRIMAINAKGVFLGTKHSIPAMRQAGGGSIVNISSIAGMVGDSASGVGYSATKGAVRVVTKVTAIQHAKDGIRCNSVHPGLLDTPMTEDMLAVPGTRAERTRDIPLARIGTAEDVAYGVLYLACDESSFVTGSELVIDGGQTAQ